MARPGVGSARQIVLGGQSGVGGVLDATPVASRHYSDGVLDPQHRNDSRHGDDPRHALARWRDELARLGGQDSLLSFQDRPEGTLDLGHAHPNGLAGFLAGRPTRLSSLFREASALDTARRRARAVAIAGARLTDEHGLPGTHLAVGMLTWPDPPAAPRDIVAPILLRPITLQPRGVGAADHELDLGGPAWLNPALARLLAQHNVTVDAPAFARLAHSSNGFTPRRALDRLTELTAHLPGCSITEQIVIGTFLDLAPSLLAALDEASDQLVAHPVVRALAAPPEGAGAGARARAAAGGAQSEPPRVSQPFARDWSTAPESSSVPVTVFSLDEQQRAAVQAAARSDVAVLAPPGAGATQVAAQMIVQAAGAGERVLVVAPRRGELTDLAERLTQAGLHCLTDDVLVPRSDTALLDPIPAVEPRLSLHRIHETWQVSQLQVLRTVAAAISEDADADPLDPATARRIPRTRLTEPALSRLVGVARSRAVGLLAEGISSGAFRIDSAQTPWFGADVTTSDEVLRALEVVERLSAHLTHLRAIMTQLLEQTGFTEQCTVGGWLRQVELMTAVRKTLAVFVPEVYTTPIDDMLVATASPQWRAQHGSTMSMMNRRRFRRSARELVQPEADPGDLHAALLRAHEERRQWARASAGGSQPVVPDTLPQSEAELDLTLDDMQYLRQVLADTPWVRQSADLLDLRIDDLQQRLLDLSGAAPSLRALPRQQRIRREVSELGLDDVSQSLAEATEVPECLERDIEIMWSAGVLREMAAEQDHLSAWQGPDTDPRVTEITWLRDAESTREPATATLATALSVPHRVPAGQRVDRVLLLGAHRLGVAEAVLSVVHGRRLAVIGDPAGPRPTGLELGDADFAETRTPRGSVLEAAAAALPTVTLRFAHRVPAELVTAADAVITAAGEQAPLGATARWRVAAPPGQQRLSLELVADGRTGPSWGPDWTETRAPEGPLDAPDSEVRRVVDLVIGHAEQAAGHRGGGESLAVLSLTRAHARRIADLLRLRLRQRPEVAQWLLRSQSDPFVITDIARAEDVVRDRVLLSLGLGLTSHGALLHRFGPLEGPDGARLLRTAVTRARQRVTVVTCISEADLDPQRLASKGLAGAGPLGLRELIKAAAQHELTEPVEEAGVPDPILALLVGALQEAGAQARVTCVDGWPQPGQPDDSSHPHTEFSTAPAAPDLVVQAPADAQWIAVLWDGRTPGVDPAAAVQRDAQLSTALTELGWQVCNVRAVDIVTARRAVASRIVHE